MRPNHRASVIQGRFTIGRPQFHTARLGAPHTGTIQPVAHGNAFQVPSSVNLSSPGGGRPLPQAVRQKMESVFNTDFSDVRVHVGPQAQQIGAIAFTLGSNLYFAPGQYNPMSSHGQRLIGHELTHVMQQRAGRVRNPFGSGVAVVQDPGMEAEADRMGMRAAMAPMPSLQAKMDGNTAQPKPAVHTPPGHTSVVNAKLAYSVHEPTPGYSDGSRQITVTAPGSSNPVGSVNIWARKSGKMMITDLSVSPDHRRQGVGTMLMQTALRIAESGKERWETNVVADGHSESAERGFNVSHTLARCVSGRFAPAFACRQLDIEPLVLEAVAQCDGHRLVILDDQHLGHRTPLSTF